MCNSNYSEDLGQSRKRRKNRRSQTYFCVGFSSFWAEPIHAVLNGLVLHFGLRWLRLSMSYHRFPNLRQMFAGDLGRKMTEGLQSLNFPSPSRATVRAGTCATASASTAAIVAAPVWCTRSSAGFAGTFTLAGRSSSSKTEPTGTSMTPR